MEKILIVDDEPDILEFVGYNLEKEGYEVHTRNNGLEGLEAAKQLLPDLIVLDVMMPEMDGIEACIEIRKNTKLKDVLIVFLSARGEDYSQVAGFDAGADDYISKPIKPRLLVSRVKAILRRKISDKKALVADAKMVVDREQYLVKREGKSYSLPKKEFELIALLASKPQKVFSREVILNTIWGGDVVVGDRTIDVHVRKLREKFGSNVIRTIKGVGYKFIDE